MSSYWWSWCNRRGRATLPAALWLCFGATSCGSDVAVRSPSLHEDVMPILQTSCAFGNGCHGAPTTAGYMQLGPAGSVSADQLLSTLVDRPSVTDPGMLRVAPGDPTNSFLLRKLRGDFIGLECVPVDCGARMPFGAPPLPDETLQTIERWVALGASQ